MMMEGRHPFSILVYFRSFRFLAVFVFSPLLPLENPLKDARPPCEENPASQHPASVYPASSFPFPPSRLRPPIW